MTLNPSQREVVSLLADKLLAVRLGVPGDTPAEQRANTLYYAERLLNAFLLDPEASRKVASVLVGHDQRRLRRVALAPEAPA